MYIPMDSSKPPRFTLESAVSSHSSQEERMYELPEVETGKKSSRQTALQTLVLAFGSLGAVYGDIGTSPLYVMNSIKIPHTTPTEDDIYGMVSIIFWMFVILVFFKYTLIVLTFGPNEGEGGQVAIYAKIARTLNFGPKGIAIPGAPVPQDLELMKRTETLKSEHMEKASWKRHPTVVNVLAFFTLALCFLGCALVISDGLLTPTTTALTAVSGIQVAVPSFSNGAIVGVSEAVLIVLFSLQVLGSTKLSLSFAPIMFTWLIGFAFQGIYNIAKWHPGVFRGLSPYYAIQLLKDVGIDALSGGMLSMTGTEAMFADVGHFGRLPIQIGICFTMICLILGYLGQAAYLVHNPTEMSNIFYASLPGGIGNGFYWFMFVMAILSTIVASQALILGVFSILAQLINLDCFPKLNVWRISKTHRGKVFIPVANFLLLIGVCAATAAFQNSNNVTGAYGLGISMDFVITSALIAICLVWVYDYNPLISIVYIAIFVPLEMTLVIANMKKVPHGAWFPLMMCAIFFTIFTSWRYFRNLLYEQQISTRVRITELFPGMSEGVNLGSTDGDDDEIAVMSTSTIDNKLGSVNTVVRGRLPLSTTPGITLVYSDTPGVDLASPNTVPSIYAHVVRNFASITSVVVFCYLRSISIPTVDDEDRVLVVPAKLPGHYKAVVRFGFTEDPIVTLELRERILRQVHEAAAMEYQPLSVFEKNQVLNRRNRRTRNPFRWVGNHVRQFVVQQVFAPANSLNQNAFNFVESAPDEETNSSKLLIGTVVRI